MRKARKIKLWSSESLILSFSSFYQGPAANIHFNKHQGLFILHACPLLIVKFHIIRTKGNDSNIVECVIYV